MGQKTSPTGFRIGITEDWRSRWYPPRKSLYGELLVEDEKIRRYIDERLNRQPPYAAVSKVEIERTANEIKVMIFTGRPGLVIGPKGAEVDKLRESLEELTDRRINVSVHEIKNADLNAKLVGEAVAEQLVRRSSFRRTMKQRAEAAMAAGALGVKIQCSGRLGGAEMKRSETTIMGSIPLATLRAHVDYDTSEARCTYGVIGIKVWIYKGSYGAEIEENPSDGHDAKTRQVPKGAKRANPRKGQSR
ncbi:MAG: 30S ribosomal protein S3 [Phycisphaerae bacterium]|nr:30S ribosomal protein S3 [Phycisphaerae bacterium]